MGLSYKREYVRKCANNISLEPKDDGKPTNST